MTGVVMRLRNHRRSLGLLTLAMTAMGAMQSATYTTVAGATAADSTFAQQSEALAQRLTFLAAPPTDLGSLGGYLTWRVFGSLALILGLWACWFAAAAVRSEERSGLTDHLLATGASRSRLVVDMAGAFAATCALVVGGLCVGLVAGAMGSLSPTAVAAQGAALFLLLCTLFALALVVAQLMSSARMTLAVAGAVTLLMSVVNSMAGQVDAFAAVRWISPFAWHSASEPLVPGGGISVTAAATSLVTAVAVTALAAWLFTRRDVGAALLARRTQLARRTTPAHPSIYAMPAVATLFEMRTLLVLWALGGLAIVAFFATVVPSIVVALADIDALGPYLRAVTDGDVERGVIGLFLLATMQLHLAMVALLFVARWAREERSGRLALELTTPVSRTAVVGRRAASVGVATLAMAAASVALLVVLAPRAGVDIAPAAAARTAAVLTIFALAVAAVGAALIGAAPRGAVIGLGIFIAASYFIKEVAPLYGWDDRVLNLSVFHLVGNPLVGAPHPVPVSALAAAAGGGFAVAALLLRRRDIATG